MTATRLTRIAHIVNGTLLILLFVGSLWVYPSLPEQIPQNIGTGVTYWDTTLLHWLSGPLITLVMTGLMYAVHLSEVMTVPLSPHVNFGSRDTYEQLSTPHKRIIARWLRTGAHWMCTPFLLIFTRMQIEFYLIAMRSAEESIFGWQWNAVEFGLYLLFVFMFFGWWVPRRIERLAEVEARDGRKGQI